MGNEGNSTSGNLIEVGDIDIDVPDRDQLLKEIHHIPAAILRGDNWVKHNTGIYVTDIPVHPILNIASIDYQIAEHRHYTKIDILNNSVYSLVRDKEHLKELCNADPPYSKLDNYEFFSQIVHIGNHHSLYLQLAEPVRSIEQMAMFLALIRPAKRNLVGLTWAEIAESVWEKNSNGAYGFKKSHSLAYAHLVVVHMNLLNSLN